MLFNSLTFVFFFFIVYALYLSLYNRTRPQNVLLLIASYVFYGYWDWRFLSLIIISTLVDFFVGRLLENTPDSHSAGRTRRKLLVTCSVLVNLSILGFFKYFNFFADSFINVLHTVGLRADPITLNIILPIGISFYTFQTMSYSLDVYWKRIKPTKSLLNFAAFVAYFPQLVAGPIERAANLLPQIEKARRVRVEQINTGLFLILWGYFKKLVIADNVGMIAERIFNNYTGYSGIDVLIGVLAFSIQIYGDFSGYSDIARGISRLMGFEIMVNFRLPYFALNPSDFWQRWHISLSSWLRDYLYIPLGGNKKGTSKTYRNLFITMLLGGLWHGAAWNFVLWGAFHGFILIAFRRFEKKPIHRDPWRSAHAIIVIAKMTFMFILVQFGWLIFRATSLRQIGMMLSRLSLTPSSESADLAARLVFFLLPLIIIEIFQYKKRDLLILAKAPSYLRVPVYAFMLVFIFIFGVRESMEFIYFQF